MTCFNNNSIKTLASLLLGGTAILGTHLGGAFAQDVHMVSEPFFEATTHVGAGFVEIESFLWDDRLPSIPVELASSSEGMASAMRSTHGPNPSAAEFEAETSLYGTMFMTLEGAHRIVANDLDWDTPEINWWTMRLDWKQYEVSVVGEEELLFFRTQFSYVMQYRITLDAPKRVVLNVGSIDRKGDTDRTLSLSSMELKAVSGFVEDAATSSGIVAHDTTPLGDFERAFAFDSLPAGDWTIRVMVSASDFEYSADRCDCPQLPCPHTVPIVEEDGYSILSMLQYLDVHPAGGGQSASQPWGAAQMLPLDPALAVEVGNDFDKVTEEANGFGAFLTSSMPAPENNEAAFGFGESFAADPEPWLSLDGTHVQSIIASAQLTAKSEAANAFGTAYAVTHGDFDFEVVMEDTVNLDIKLERSGEDNWDEAAMGTWAYELGNDQQWTQLTPARTSQDGMIQRYQLSAGGIYRIGSSVDLYAGITAENETIEREVCETLEIHSQFRFPGDFDGDGKANGPDLSRLLGAWGTDDFATDINSDGWVDGQDLAILLGGWKG